MGLLKSIGEEHLDSWADYFQFWLQLGIILKLLISSQAFHRIRVLSIKKRVFIHSPFGFFSAIHVEQYLKQYLTKVSGTAVTDTCPKPCYVHVFHTLTQIKSGFSSIPWNDCDCSSTGVLFVGPSFCFHPQTPHIHLFEEIVKYHKISL